LSTGSLGVPTAPTERGSPAWHCPLDAGAVVDAGLDEGVRDARHLGGDGRERLATEIGTGLIPRDVTLERIAEAVVSLAAGNLPRDLEGSPQAGVSELREAGLAAEPARLMSREIEPAELQELSMVREAAEVARLGEDRQGVDRPDAADRPQTPIVGMVGEEELGAVLDLVAAGDQAAAFRQGHAKHGDGFSRHRQTDRRPRRLVDVREPAVLRDLAADHGPGGGDERLLVEHGDRGRYRERFEQRQKPVASRVAAEPLGLGEVQRQIVRQQAVSRSVLAWATISCVFESSWMSTRSWAGGSW